MSDDIRNMMLNDSTDLLDNVEVNKIKDFEKSLSAKLSDVDILLQFCHVSKQQSHQVEVGRMCQVFRGAVCNHWQDQIS